ncbi:MAG TPA: multidrug efflux RND transporter permease subunit [Candidatus Acidoferrales bacterium]|nr:multidrug efflux RND transporter permease subunit [Candidatus Acidoferrales bacterium]
MAISAPFIRRPIGTSLLTIAVLLAGTVAYMLLPVAPLPEVEFPTIQVQASLPGASPETMASAVATPLERQLGRIAGVTEMTSESLLGSTRIVLQFELSRDINAAARDVQAAINAAGGQLPANLPQKPHYWKVNPADSPILILAMRSKYLPLSTLYDVSDSIVAQKLAQVNGVGQVFVGGSARPAVRIEVNPAVLAAQGIGLDSVRAAIGQINSNLPKGDLSNGRVRWMIYDNDQLYDAARYQRVIVAYHNGAGVRLGDIATVRDSVEDVYNAGLDNGTPCVTLIVFRQPGANIVGTVDRVRALLPVLQASLPASAELSVAEDRTTTIRASVDDIQITLLITVFLVIMVIFIFLRSVWATVIPAVAVPVSLIGTFGVMYLFGYSVDNLSLMALAIVTGFVVDDAIVVIENVTRYLEAGLSPLQAAMKGSKEIGFTVLSMSTSLIAVFIPILLMGGIVGRLFREFAVTLSIAIIVSLLVSLTTTPMLCAKFLRPVRRQKHNWMYRFNEWWFEKMLAGYDRGIQWVLRHQPLTLAITILTVLLNGVLFYYIPKGFFPQQDTGALSGSVQAAQDISFDAMKIKQKEFSDIVMQDPAVESVVAYAGGSGSTSNSGHMFISLKPLSQRKASADQVIARLRRKLAVIPGATLFLQANQDIRMGGRRSNAEYQYTLESENLADLDAWTPRVLQRLKKLPQLRDVSTDQEDKGLETSLAIDRDTASRLGISTQAIDGALYDAFGQRQVSTMYDQLNEYHVVMTVAPAFQENSDALKGIYVQSSNGAEVPLSAFSHFHAGTTTLAVNHQGQFPAITLSFNLAPGVALGDAVSAIQAAESDMGLPATVHASFQGSAQAFQASLANEGMLILAALAAVYIVLGMLYESFIHPVTILSTLPSAGVGAILALEVFHLDLSVIAIIGIILLIGIVKKNAIMMIDFALDTERKDGKTPEEAIYTACLLRFRPIMMTTMAALLGALPLAVGTGMGSEMRRPLGISIVGGLIVSQMLTLFTTPVVYLYMDRLRLRWMPGAQRRAQALARRPGQPGLGHSATRSAHDGAVTVD